jgi:pimeloyl-ACP methyl ester carboxylesterase
MTGQRIVDFSGGMVCWKFFYALLLAAASMIFSGCDIQNRLLYYPYSSSPSRETLEYARLKPWPSNPSNYRGLTGIDETGFINGTVIVFHGNAGAAVDRAFYVKALGELGYRAILAEYPMYGGRRGALGEKSFVIDGIETIRLAAEQFGEPIFLLGESLGCGVAAAVIRQTSVNISGVVLITPWDSLESIARSKFPFLPVRLLLTDTYDNIGNLGSFKGRIAIIGAEHDDVIPVEHAKTLFNSLSNETKRMWIIKGAGHNNWPMTTDRSWWITIMDFAGGKDTQ